MKIKLALLLLTMTLWTVNTNEVGEKTYTSQAIEPVEVVAETVEEETKDFVLLDTVALLGDEQILIQKICNESGIDYKFVYSLVYSESKFIWQTGDHNLNHPAIGYFQISTINQKRMMDDYGLDIFDRLGNVEAGMRIIQELYEQYKDGFLGYDAETCVIMCYKCGPNRGRQLMEQGTILKVVNTIKEMKDDFIF